MASIFSRIIAGEIPCYKVAENETCIAFLDINPVVRGHVLVVPKMEVDQLFELPEDAYLQLMAFAKKVAAGIKKAIPCVRVGMEVVGLDVPHAHIHLIALNGAQDMNLGKEKLSLSKEEFEAIAAQISSAIL